MFTRPVKADFVAAGEVADSFYLTAAGQHYRQAQQPAIFIPSYYQGLCIPQGQQGIELLYLAIQVISEYHHGQKHYIPGTTNYLLQQRVRQWFQQVKHYPQLSQQLVQELTRWLTALPADQADFVAQNFQGYQFGFQQSELADKTPLSGYSQQLVQLDALALLLQYLAQQPQAFPLLGQLLIPDQWVQPILSYSANLTYQAFMAGQSLKQIGYKRRLKDSTIREHILEVALLMPGFDFEQLKQQDDLPPTDYFNIRVAEIQEMSGHERPN
ncbi:hypothetical protein JCM14202_969 [Agrilactobacillus composti DSM 18527 = JCM 14202]|uniref:helix-turn-helix domain-containing protein n=1 Tax=Agrilactobacillus composti TaxID=398555 RepID=UPI00042DFF06|nr:helix-turn-helix domain-containing protein [Agrilactobacillus composti]GAF39126.1 hypothetical protein JCM14202_969 [Agrilactobacillus composti DSM 18527 = JCM 14202]